jgi:hypothetical protein
MMALFSTCFFVFLFLSLTLFFFPSLFAFVVPLYAYTMPRFFRLDHVREK